MYVSLFFELIDTVAIINYNFLKGVSKYSLRTILIWRTLNEGRNYEYEFHRR